ncbi:MAG: restriction endonuclease subunit S, partial [Syntrophomonadaceae bacterium]|nr:restriction endonuclease subunit S [Syntrophomonadaceae bacterium]
KLTAEWRKQHPMVKDDPQYDAVTFLAQIKSEKDLLVKNGKTQKEKILPRITDVDRPLALPDGWVSCRFGDVVSSMNNGIYKPAQFYSETKGTPSMRMYNIQDGKLDLSKIARMILTDDEITQYALHSGDLLLNRVNSRELIGKVALVNDLNEATVYEAMNIRIRLLEKDHLPRFLTMVFRTENVRNFFQQNAKQASGQVSINQPQVASVSIPLPPPAEQQAIVARVDSLMVDIDELEKEVAERKEQSQLLLKTVLREAFDGGVTN